MNLDKERCNTIKAKKIKKKKKWKILKGAYLSVKKKNERQKKINRFTFKLRLRKEN